MADAIPTIEVDGRLFENLPRVKKCVDKMQAAIFFHSMDNPYGNPLGVYELWEAAGPERIRERLYGVAIKQQAGRFAKFNKEIHVIDDAAIPKIGTRYHFIDPSSARNFLMHWWIDTPEGSYLYREWPGNYDIPGIGVPGPWAVPDPKKADGKKGDAQKSFGWGFERYKLEIARLEGWKEYEAARLSISDGEEQVLKNVKHWREERGAREIIEARYVDSRAASSPRIENDRPVTLLDDLAEFGLYCELTPGDDIEDGCQKIIDMLDYNANEKLSFVNKPKMFIARSCLNTIFSLETWTGADGNKGASKDPIDLLRYKVLADLGYVEPESWLSVPGGSY